MVTLENVKFSDIDLTFIKDYLRVDYNDDDIELTLYLMSAKAYIIDHSGKNNLLDKDGITQLDPLSELDKIGYSPILLLKLVADMYTNKSATVDSNIKEDVIFKMLMNKIRDYTI